MTAAAFDSLIGYKSGNPGALGSGEPEFRSCLSTDGQYSLVKLLICPELQAPIIQWQLRVGRHQGLKAWFMGIEAPGLTFAMVRRWLGQASERMRRWP